MGQRPPRMRKREDLPQPLGPMMRRWWLRRTVKERLGTSMSPLGEIMGTLINSMSGDGMDWPRDWRMSWWEAEEVAEETICFWKWPAWISSRTSRRVATREVWPASSVISL